MIDKRENRVGDPHADEHDVQRGFARLVEIHGSARKAKAWLAWVVRNAERAGCWQRDRRQILIAILRAAA